MDRFKKPLIILLGYHFAWLRFIFFPTALIIFTGLSFSLVDFIKISNMINHFCCLTYKNFHEFLIIFVGWLWKKSFVNFTVHFCMYMTCVWCYWIHLLVFTQPWHFNHYVVYADSITRTHCSKFKRTNNGGVQVKKHCCSPAQNLGLPSCIDW